MGNRWFSLFLGAALIHSLLALSPIPVLEDEWEEFAKMLRNPAYRLPTTTRPSRYEVNLTPYFDITPTINISPFSFDGEVKIQIYATVENVTEIVMHCNSLTISNVTVSLNNNPVAITRDVFECEMPYSFLRIPTAQPLQLNQEYVVSVTYSGTLKDTMRGFYRSHYRDSSGIRWMGTTQFQPGHAREAFPCYDEPGFKAYFDITINREPDFSPSISNMPIRVNQTLSNGRVAETFYTTPLTSTYLVAFIVSHYTVVSAGTNPDRPFNIYARENANTTGDWSLYIGELLLEEMERYTNISYYEMQENLDMKQAAIPDFSAGAMENWGLLTYREALILYDPLNSNHFYRQRVANIVSHEVAHMWFGNLVTCAWWDNLWLNEGFARFYQYYLTQSNWNEYTFTSKARTQIKVYGMIDDKVAPDLRYDIRFIVEQVHLALLSDSVDSAHALTNPDVNDPVTVSNHFSTITYARGASIIRMTQHLLGDNTFVNGLRRYLSARKFDVAEPHHLFEALDAAAAELGALVNYGGITIDSYFRTWSEKAGHPVLKVNINHRTGQMNVTQSRWERDTGSSQFDSLWQIPITWTRANSINFDNLKPSQILTQQNTLIERGTQGYEWVIFNKQQSGFYRVNYDDDTWILITRALRGANRSQIHELNRAQIVDDVFNFARAGVMTYDQAFNILSFLEFEDSYAPWIAAITGFNFAINRLSYDDANVQRLKNQAITLSGAITSRLGYSERDGETYMDGLLRMYVLTFLCNIGHPQCLSAARENFASWRNGAFVPANMRPWVYCSGLSQGNASDFDYFWDRYLNEDLASEIVVMIQAGGCTSDQESLDKFLNAIINTSNIIRPQDHSTAWSSAVTGNEINTMRLFDWLRRNVNQVIQNLGTAATPVSNIASRLRNETQINEFSNWLEQNQVLLGSAYNTGVSGVASTRQNIAWSSGRLAEFVRFFEMGYVDGTLEDISDGDDDEDNDGDSEGDNGDPDSANITTLSFITLITTLAINFLY